MLPGPSGRDSQHVSLLAYDMVRPDVRLAGGLILDRTPHAPY